MSASILHKKEHNSIPHTFVQEPASKFDKRQVSCECYLAHVGAIIIMK